jgi:uncharacterized membrane-anchored protein YhcB (DUF1043 family)
MKIVNRVALILIGVLIFFLGYILGEVNIKGFTLNREAGIEINPFDIIVLVVQVLLAYYVVNQLNSRFQSDRIVRDTLIQEVDSFSTRIDEKFSELQSGQVHYQSAAKLFKELMTKHGELYLWYNETGLIINTDNKQGVFNSLKHSRNLVTADGVQDSAEKNEVKDSVIHISNAALLQIEIEKNKILHKLFLVKLDLNGR